LTIESEFSKLFHFTFSLQLDLFILHEFQMFFIQIGFQRGFRLDSLLINFLNQGNFLINLLSIERLKLKLLSFKVLVEFIGDEVMSESILCIIFVLLLLHLLFYDQRVCQIVVLLEDERLVVGFWVFKP